MKVKRIAAAGVADVYNMEVEDTHSLAVNGGVIAHNCYDEARYICMANPIAPRANVKPAMRGFDPLSTDDDTQYAKYAWYERY